MDITPPALLRTLLPTLPSITRTAILAVLSQTPQSQHQDALTQIIVASARPILGTPTSILKAQDFFNTDWLVVGRMWVAKWTVPISPVLRSEGLGVVGLHVRNAVRVGVEALKPGYLKDIDVGVECEIPDLVPVQCEWTGYRPNAYPFSTLPRGKSQRQLYDFMMQDLTTSTTTTSASSSESVSSTTSFLGPTIIYFHGGAHCLMSPATHRLVTSSLAQESGGRVLSVAYRLAPQHVFPAALIDALVAYLSLLCPPPGSFHDAVAANKIVLAGDSSGAGLAASLLLLLLELARQKVSIQFHGTTIQIPTPPYAGLAMMSPYLDITRSLPSTTQMTKWDIIAPPPFDAASPPFPHDEIWPTSPPRAETYCAANMAGHPLVSPLAASTEMWSGSPPVYIGVGWEGCGDEGEVLARRVHGDGGQERVRVVFDGWEGMPHCFAVVPWNEAGRQALRNWGMFCRYVVEEKDVGNDEIDLEGGVGMWERLWREEWKGMGTWTRSTTREVKQIRLEKLGLTQVGCGYERTVPLGDKEVDRRIEEGVRWRGMLEEKMQFEWRGQGKLEADQMVQSRKRL